MKPHGNTRCYMCKKKPVKYKQWTKLSGTFYYCSPECYDKDLKENGCAFIALPFEEII